MKLPSALKVTAEASDHLDTLQISLDFAATTGATDVGLSWQVFSDDFTSLNRLNNFGLILFINFISPFSHGFGLSLPKRSQKKYGP